MKEENKRQAKWHRRYLELAKLISSWSRDPSSKIGAVAIGDNGQVLAQGYNGLPRGVEDKTERYNKRELKYQFIVHAEMNVIYNAIINGVPLKGSTLYIYGLPPCHECAKGVIQSGIKKIVIPKYKDVPTKWATSLDLSLIMLGEAGVEVLEIEDLQNDQDAV